MSNQRRPIMTNGARFTPPLQPQNLDCETVMLPMTIRISWLEIAIGSAIAIVNSMPGEKPLEPFQHIGHELLRKLPRKPLQPCWILHDKSRQIGS